jgi:hypothetical protein
MLGFLEICCRLQKLNACTFVQKTLYIITNRQMLKINPYTSNYLEVHLRIFKADLRGFIMLQAASQGQ